MTTHAGKRDVDLHVLVPCIRCCKNCGLSNARLLTYLESDDFIRSRSMRCKLPMVKSLW